MIRNYTDVTAGGVAAGSLHFVYKTTTTKTKYMLRFPKVGCRETRGSRVTLLLATGGVSSESGGEAGARVKRADIWVKRLMRFN